MSRAFTIVVLALSMCIAAGCQDEDAQKDGWQDIKVSDLATKPVNPGSGVKQPQRADFDVHIFEIPADKVSMLNRLWPTLESRPLAFKSRQAFAQNGFSAGFGRAGRLDDIAHLVAGAGGHEAITIRLSPEVGKYEMVRVTTLGTRMKVYYKTADGSLDNTMVGPGIFGLRMITSRPSGMVGTTDLTVNPVVMTPPGAVVLPGEPAQRPEMTFMDMAFRVRMNAGDIVVLGPRDEVKYWAMIGGMTFSKPEGSMFAERGKRPAVLPAARIFVFVCKGVSY